MCQTVINSLKQAPTLLLHVATEVSNAYARLGRRIQSLTNDRLPPTVAKIVQQIYNSLPYSVTAYVAWKKMPTIVTLPAIVLYVGAHTYQDWILPENTYKNIWYGLCNASMVITLQHTAMFMRTKIPGLAVLALGYLTFAQIAYRRADRLCAIDDTPAVIQQPRTAV